MRLSSLVLLARSFSPFVSRSLWILDVGMSKETEPDWKGRELTESYGSFDVNPEKYFNKTVGIIGTGNSAFEVVNSLMAETAYIFVYGERHKMAWSTHYPGDLRSS